MREISSDILKGKARIAPANYDGSTACRYCKFRSVCQFDVLFADNRYRFVKKLSHDEVLRKLMGAEGGENNG